MAELAEKWERIKVRSSIDIVGIGTVGGIHVEVLGRLGESYWDRLRGCSGGHDQGNDCEISGKIDTLRFHCSVMF